MKTVTVTHQNAINYGAVFQAYALQKQLQKLGVEDEILDLEVAFKIFNKVKFNKHLLGNLYNNILSLLHILETKKRIKRFREFVKNNIRTTRHYRTIKEVADCPPEADVYITGSDQTFNTHSGVKPHNFLQFGSKDIKRISYAASMGKPKVKDEYLDEFISAVKAYSFISVREPCSAEYISKICKTPCSTNLDPAFLLSKEEWSRLASNSKISPDIKKREYILVYQLLENPMLNDAVKKISKETGLEIIVITPYAMCRIKGNLIIRDAGPIDFLRLFENAKYILTTTFHGVCFSVIFQKDFSTFIYNKDEIRITHILNLLNLSDRIITNTNKMTFNKISYDSVNEIIEIERKKSIEYLVKALGI